MNIEAFIAVSAATSILGIILGSLAWCISHWLKRRHRKPQLQIQITRAGLLFYSAMVLTLLFATAWASFQTESWLGFLYKHGGIMVLIVLIAVPFTLVAIFLETRGVQLSKNRSSGA